MYRFVNKVFTFINHYSPYFFLTPNYKSFGNCAEEIFFGLLLAEQSGRKLILIRPCSIPFIRKLNIANKYLFDIQHKNLANLPTIIKIVLNLLCTAYLYLLYICDGADRVFCNIVGLRYKNISAKRIPSIGKNDLWTPSTDLKEIYDKRLLSEQITHFNNFISPKLPNISSRNLQLELSNIGIGPDDWFVVLHAPYSKVEKNIRQVNIENYIESIKYIINKGGWVIRIGDKGSPKLPKMEKVIDYANFPKQSKLLNLYFLERAKFFVGATSGPSYVAHLFGAKCIGVNRTHFIHDYSFQLSILKHVHIKKTGERLSLNQVLKSSPDSQFFEHNNDSLYSLTENSPDEILSLIKESFDFNTKLISPSQNSFNKDLISYSERYFFSLGYPNKFEAIENSDISFYQFRALLQSPLCFARGFYGKQFLKKNYIPHKE
tara:strand:- start:264 stop:1562 length:1299 start_codon:yes stop_codon:yes gene_type:complete